MHGSEIGELREWIDRQVRMGFRSDDEIATTALDVFYEDNVDEDEVSRLVAEIADRYAVPSGRTDCDRLDDAFAALESAGIVARQCFSCCSTCGAYDINEEIARAEDDGRTVDGFTFYHQQDAERAAEGAPLFLTFGAVDSDEDEDTVQIGRRIVEQLEAVGLETDWDGTAERRILVTLEWKRDRSRRKIDPPPAERADAVEDWCAAFTPVCARDLASSLPVGDALLAVGATESAEAWVVSLRDPGRIARIASEIGGERGSQLYLEALRLVPRRDSRGFELLDLM